MNCYYHTERKAVIQCKNCKKGLCSDCCHLFKSNLCMDCEKEMATKNIVKAIATILVSVILAVISYIVFINMEHIKNEFIYGIVSFVKDFYDNVVTIFEYIRIDITDEFKNNLSLILSVYFLSSVPWGYYCLSKLTGCFSGGILGIIILLYFKILISCFIGPIVMPISIIILIKSIIKSRKKLSDISKQEE